LKEYQNCNVPVGYSGVVQADSIKNYDNGKKSYDVPVSRHWRALDFSGFKIIVQLSIDYPVLTIP
jgi:hypothetical protein